MTPVKEKQIPNDCSCSWGYHFGEGGYWLLKNLNFSCEAHRDILRDQPPVSA